MSHEKCKFESIPKLSQVCGVGTEGNCDLSKIQIETSLDIQLRYEVMMSCNRLIDLHPHHASQSSQ